MTGVEGNVRKLMRLAFKCEIPSTPDFKKDDVPEWDSLNHVELVFLLEEEFGVQFAPEQVDRLTSFLNIVSALNASGR